MNRIKITVATIALMAATATTVQAGDSVNIGVHIGTYGGGYPAHSIGTHRHAPAFYGYYDAPIVYYSAQPVIYYAPPIPYHHYQPHHYKGRDVRDFRYEDRSRHYHNRDDGRRNGRR